MSKVLILGAGASRSAGYPLTSGLLDSLRDFARDCPDAILRKNLTAWDVAVSELPEPMRMIARNPNLEVALSLPDLCALAVDEESRLRTAAAVAKFKETGIADPTGLEEYFDSEERQALQDLRNARGRLLGVVDTFFRHRHRDDRNRRPERRYLDPVLSELGPGDAVITLNWDTLVERALAESHRWNPVDGYGFDKPLHVMGPLGNAAEIPRDMWPASEIKVLKLHGSFGWRTTDDGVFFEAVQYLEGFGFQNEGRAITIVDPEAPDVSYFNPALLAYPSYLKKLEHPTLAQIWRMAAAALSRAEHVDVWGYSLPPSDYAVRALLTGLSDRLERGEVRVKIHDPDSQARDRWITFLGARADAVDESL